MIAVQGAQDLICYPTLKRLLCCQEKSEYYTKCLTSDPCGNTGAISELPKSVPQLRIYDSTVPELTLTPPLNSQNIYLYLQLLLHLHLYLSPLFKRSPLYIPSKQLEPCNSQNLQRASGVHLPRAMGGQSRIELDGTSKDPKTRRSKYVEKCLLWAPKQINVTPCDGRHACNNNRPEVHACIYVFMYTYTTTYVLMQ